ECGNYKVLKLLIKAGHDVNSANEDGRTPLMTSLIQICLDGKKELKKEDLKIPKILLKSGAKVKIVDKKGMTRASSINKLDSFNASPLHYVTRSMKLHFVKNTLSKKSSGKPKLFEPTAENQMECMRLLVARGADVNHKNKCGINVFHDVFENSKLWEFIQYLLDQGCVVDYRDKRLIRLMKLGHGMPNMDMLLRHTAVCESAPNVSNRNRVYEEIF
ncbi:serine/threonine-protein phosphatase 6 regulatory ankyrin repeat subunit C-like, partial [Copidosoma floridanum]|uniref:serine/threonine-protein phosphatase 6 regulatory ankyrin repeat subunit C-like n=1 Tax=Copidosoma floridanum TaxID=29053 RepID=UPI000C6FB3B1